MDRFFLFPWPYLATAALAALTGFYVWTRPHRPGTRYFGWLAGLWLVWSLAGALQVMVRHDPLLLGLFMLMSCISMLESVLHLMIALEYTGNEKWLARREMNILFLPAVLVALMYILWPDWVGMVEVHAGVQVIQGNASVKWIFASFPLLISLLTLGVLLNCLLRAPAFWAPLLLLSLGRIFPTVGYLAVEPRNIPVSPVQATVLFTGFTILVYMVALYSFRILQVIPVARDAVIAHLPYSLIVLDSENRLVDFNAAAQSLPELPGKLTHQQPASRALGSWWERLSPLTGSDRAAWDVTVFTDGEKRILHVASLPLSLATGRRIGQAFLIEDITRERQIEQQHEQAQGALAMLREREQLARELHDSLGQTLGYINLQAQALCKRARDGNFAALDGQLARLAEVAQEAHQDIRESIFSLRGGPAEQWNFVIALRQYLSAYQERYGIRAGLELPAGLDEDLFEPGAGVQILRVIQEALTNARKHGRAGGVQVSFAAVDDGVRITIADDGCGFDPSLLVGETGHYGLQFMQERVEQIGGALRFDSAPGMGTRITIDAPLKTVNNEIHSPG